MERLAELIGKLKEQFEQKADQSQLLVITQMIQEELMRSVNTSKKTAGSSKVAVVMPAARTIAAAAPEPQPVQSPKAHAAPMQQQTTRQEDKETAEAEPQQQEQSGWLFDPLKEIPTLAHQENVKELNDLIGFRDASLNDKLKAEVIEVGHRLKEAPIRDLKRAIGVNDRFVFINELFRGDEVMYERSIKTINNFRIFAEAEYWIERELKVKLGWLEDNPTTKHFYHLVKRRFL
jgi:hypothetical protein